MRGIELNPGNTCPHALCAAFLVGMRRFSEDNAEYKIELEIYFCSL